jgi:hypothetical protein
LGKQIKRLLKFNKSPLSEIKIEKGAKNPFDTWATPPRGTTAPWATAGAFNEELL